MSADIWTWNLQALSIFAKHLNAAQAEYDALDTGVSFDVIARVIVEGETTSQVLELKDDDQYGYSEVAL